MMRHLLLIALLANLACAQYYADMSFEISDDGLTRLSGESNHPGLKTCIRDDLTSKSGPYWIFNMSLGGGDIFSDLVYEVILPENAQINYVKTRGIFGIRAESGRMIVSGVSSESDMSVVVQYSIARPQVEYGIHALALGALLAAALACLGLRMRAGKREKPRDLTERQNRILEFIEGAGKPVTQTMVCEALGLAKSSVSRNVETLVGKGYLKKENVGMNSYLYPR